MCKSIGKSIESCNNTRIITIAAESWTLVEITHNYISSCRMQLGCDRCCNYMQNCSQLFKIAQKHSACTQALMCTQGHTHPHAHLQTHAFMCTHNHTLLHTPQSLVTFTLLAYLSIGDLQNWVTCV